MKKKKGIIDEKKRDAKTKCNMWTVWTNQMYKDIFDIIREV